MRCALALWSVLLCSSSLWAAPRNQDTKPAGPPLGPDEGSNYALQLKTAVDMIARQYAKPVKRPALLAAALRGLYAAVGRPLPPSLPAALKKADSADNKLIDLLMQTREQLGNPGPLQGSKALEASLWAALKSLDPYCFLTSSDAYERKNTKDKDGAGLELENTVDVGPLRVKSVLPGSPAQKAGLRPGDQITHLDGETLQGKRAVYSGAVWRRLTEGSKNKSFRLAVLRAGMKSPRKITLEPRAFQAETVFGVTRDRDNSWNYLFDPKQKIAHIRLGFLKQGTAADLQQVLDKLQKAGMRGLILDLRWCPGGLLDEAVDVASLFVGDRTIATIDYRDGRKQTCTRRESGGGQAVNATFLDFPLVALVNGETQGGGELIAAAIQDAKRGAVAGQRTVGKGSVQNVVTTEQGQVYQTVSNLTIRLSIGVFTRATGKNLQRFATSKPIDDWGVRPDAKMGFAVSKELSQHLRELWSLQNLRPGSSDEELPMDDPANDAQRQFAFKALVQMLNKAKLSK